MKWLPLLVGLGACVVAAACADDASDSGPAAEADAGQFEEDAATPEADAGKDAEEEEAGPTPTGATDVEADIGEATRTLERAQFGTSSGPTYYLEVHQGGVEECPEKETPARTMVVSNVPSGAPGESFDEGDGVSASYLDFTGDQITADNPTTKATKVKVTWVRIVDDESIELAIVATFPEGAAKGRIYATYCAAMND